MFMLIIMYVCIYVCYSISTHNSFYEYKYVDCNFELCMFGYLQVLYPIDKFLTNSTSSTPIKIYCYQWEC